MRVIDLSHTLYGGMPVYPGDAPLRLDNARALAADGYNAYHITSGLHAGTHIDAPLHMLDDARTLDAFPVETFVGRGVVLDARGRPVVDYDPAYDALVAESDILLVCTGHDALFGAPAYYERYPVMTEAFARFALGRGVRLLGMDTPAPDVYPFAIHKLLLGAGLCLIENLCNLELLLGLSSFTVCAAPLKIRAEGSFVRALALAEA